jgi:hypothetical protein
MDKLAEEQLRRYDDLVTKRKAERDNDWQIIAAYSLPQDSNITTQKTEGISGWTDLIFDTTTIHAMETLASGLGNWWTPPNQPWAEYGAPDEIKQDEHAGADEATSWLGKASEKAMRELGRSNFYMTKGMGDTGLAVFATDLILVDESNSGRDLFNFVHCKIGTYVIEEDYRGIVDTVRREIEMTYRQICQMFDQPGDNIPQKMADQCKGAKGPQKKLKVIHCIFPREDSDRLPKRRDGANKPIASVYISFEFKECIRTSGYDESPILCRRFKKWATAWGYGPGYLALPDARQVNYVQQYLDALAELHAYPRTQIPDSLDGDVDMRAGGATVVNGDDMARGVMPKEWATVGDYKLGVEMQEQRRQAIRDACYVDAFKLLNSQPLLEKEMTAYEISQRQAEQLHGLTAVDSRTIPEFINPLMQRIFGIMFRAGKLKNPPESLYQEAGDGKKGLVMPAIVVTSRFNDALRALKNRGTEETVKFLMPMTEQKPELWDNFDLDDMAVGYAENTGMSPSSIRKKTGPNSVAAIRQQRAQMQAAQRQAQLAEMLGKAGKGLGGSPQFMQDAVKDAMPGAKGQAA